MCFLFFFFFFPFLDNCEYMCNRTRCIANRTSERSDGARSCTCVQSIAPRTSENPKFTQNSSSTRSWLTGIMRNLINSMACWTRPDVTACMAKLMADCDMPPIELRGCWKDLIAKKCSTAVTFTTTGSAYGQLAVVSSSSARRWYMFVHDAVALAAVILYAPFFVTFNFFYIPS